MNHKRKYYLLTGLALLFIGVFFFTTTDIQAEDDLRGRIAFVDLWKIFNVHPLKSAAEEELNQAAQSMQSELESRASELPEEEQQSLLEEYQVRLSLQEEGLIQEILQQIREAVKEVAASKGIGIVLDKQSVIYGGYDLTRDVIEYIQAGYQEGSAAEEGDTSARGNSPESTPDGGSDNTEEQSGDSGENAEDDSGYSGENAADESGDGRNNTVE